MGEIPWGPESPSNVNEGGNWRRAGEAEPDILKAKGLSEAEIVMAAENEAYNKKELALLENILAQKGWRAADAMDSQKAQDMIGKELPPAFRYNKLKVHLKALAEKESNRFRRSN